MIFLQQFGFDNGLDVCCVWMYQGVIVLIWMLFFVYLMVRLWVIWCIVVLVMLQIMLLCIWVRLDMLLMLMMDDDVCCVNSGCVQCDSLKVENRLVLKILCYLFLEYFVVVLVMLLLVLLIRMCRLLLWFFIQFRICWWFLLLEILVVRVCIWCCGYMFSSLLCVVFSILMLWFMIIRLVLRLVSLCVMVRLMLVLVFVIRVVWLFRCYCCWVMCFLGLCLLCFDVVRICVYGRVLLEM